MYALSEYVQLTHVLYVFKFKYFTGILKLDVCLGMIFWLYCFLGNTREQNYLEAWGIVYNILCCKICLLYLRFWWLLISKNINCYDKSGLLQKKDFQCELLLVSMVENVNLIIHPVCFLFIYAWKSEK